MLIASTIQNDYCIAEEAKTNEIYLCPGCRGPVRLKRGKEKVAHFAHVSKQGCSGFSEGESADHLAGKLALFRYFSKKMPVQIEPVLSMIDQRPDLLVGRPGSQVAIEYQCSPIGKADLERRNAGYARIGMRVWWILGPNYWRKRLSTATVCRFWLKGRIWFYLSEKEHFVREDFFRRLDFKKRFARKTVLKDPLELSAREVANWAKIFDDVPLTEQIVARPPILDVARQRAKLSLQLAREQINPAIVNYLYEKGQRVDQLPDICLLGDVFGLVIPNWQYRLTVLLLLEKAGNDGISSELLEQRLSRYFYPGFGYEKAVFDCLMAELQEAKYVTFNREKFFIKRKLIFNN